MINYKLISIRPGTLFLFELEEKVFLKDRTANGKIIMTNNCIDPVWEFEIEEINGDCLYDNGNCIIYFQRGKSTFINISNGRSERTENRYYFLKKDYGSVYVAMRDTSKIVIENENQLQIPLLQSQKWFYDKYLVEKLWDNNTLLCTDLSSGNELWKVSFDILGADVRRMDVIDMSFYKDTMYFFAIGSETDSTFCMHLQTGKIIQQYPDLRGYNSIESDTLYNLFFDQLNTLHIPTGRQKTYNLKPVFNRNNIERADYSSWLVHQGMIYFTESTGADMHSGITGAKVLLLDISTGQISWQYTLPVKCGLISVMRIAKNRLYIHTQDNSLLIFER